MGSLMVSILFYMAGLVGHGWERIRNLQRRREAEQEYGNAYRRDNKGGERHSHQGEARHDGFCNNKELVLEGTKSSMAGVEGVVDQELRKRWRVKQTLFRIERRQVEIGKLACSGLWVDVTMVSV